MKDVLFSIEDGLGDSERSLLLHKLKGTPGVVAATPLKADARSARMRRVCVVRIDDNASVTAMVERLRGLEGVEAASVEVPAPRVLPGRPGG